ncbi:ATP-binding cassette domain-containing protein [Buchnera aphidicola]|uniref:ATP-binding cassette domain-containing protein n=1 Tax=Buchnera aphidicola TaxID=9 RepID=UPI003A71D926
MIKIKNIYFRRYKTNILKNISFSLEKNEIITLIGPNGAGKSTLIKIILKLEQPTSGKVIYSHKKRIGYIPQNFCFNTPFPITVYRFMKLINPYTDNQILFSLEQLGAKKLIYRNLNNLSGGEIQKVLLAYAFLNKPEFLVLDEPTQGLDISGQMKLYNLINQIKKYLQCTILIVSHDLNFVMRKTNKVICLNKHICCSGTPESISQDRRFIKIFGKLESQRFSFYNHHHNHQHNF